ncbi:MAG: SH3 domain-containing protein [Thermoflexales bacterium]|nr:SH3 domain-containing protein [Thermoflexales bacterium]MCS7325305.1 SH3 domain-containing protein [Thermoflexales bacterium]MCX7938814.1 SH3 domain-containing protein [Thermoflexales bacterium]MDW8053034.1 SH3 domain-containing protein [Anaerolineae bacterium]MDW8291687.1 SH3 domain-containing protein [Anaerolineae bacterium]
MVAAARVRCLCWWLVGLLLAAWSGALRPAEAQTSGNLLRNPRFDWPAQTNPDLCAIGVPKDNAITPHEWSAYWTCKSGAEVNQDQINRAPEFRVMTVDIAADRVRSYPTSASFFNYWSLNRSAGLYQLVRGVQPGTRLRFSFWANLLTTNSNELPLSSAREPGGLQVRACIQTLGRVILKPDVNDPTTVCGPWIRPYDTWGQASVEAVAASDVIAVVIDATAEYPVIHNDVYVDDAELVVVSGPTPTPQLQAPAAAQPAPTQAQAQSASSTAPDRPAVIIKTPFANLRTSPLFDDRNILAQLPQGTQLPLKAHTPDRQWWQVEYAGREAFLHVSVIDFNEAARAALGMNASAAGSRAATGNNLASNTPQVVAQTGKSRLRVRAAPSPRAAIIASVPSGTALTVLGISSDRNWWRVQFPEAPNGEAWVMAVYVTPNAAARQRFLSGN